MQRLRNIGAWLTALFGPSEIAMYVALALVVIGLWPVLGRPTLAIAGAVMLWTYLPSRVAFVLHPDKKRGDE